MLFVILLTWSIPVRPVPKCEARWHHLLNTGMLMAKGDQSVVKQKACVGMKITKLHDMKDTKN